MHKYPFGILPFLTLMFMTYSSFEQLDFSQLFSVAQKCFKDHPYMMASFDKIVPKEMTKTFKGELVDTDFKFKKVCGTKICRNRQINIIKISKKNKIRKSVNKLHKTHDG